jgi:nucleolar protein 56
MVRAKKIDIDSFKSGICAVYSGILKINYSYWFVCEKSELEDKINKAKEIYGNQIKCRIFPSETPDDHFEDFVKTKGINKISEYLIEGPITSLTTTIKKITNSGVIQWTEPKDDDTDNEKENKKDKKIKKQADTGKENKKKKQEPEKENKKKNPKKKKEESEKEESESEKSESEKSDELYKDDSDKDSDKNESDKKESDNEESDKEESD